MKDSGEEGLDAENDGDWVAEGKFEKVWFRSLPFWRGLVVVLWMIFVISWTSFELWFFDVAATTDRLRVLA